MPVCRECGLDKPPKAFHWKVRAKNQRQSRCKNCTAEYGRKWRMSTPERRTKMLEYNRSYYDLNRAELLAQKKSYYESNRDQVRATTKAHRDSIKDTPEFKLKCRARALRLNFGLTLADFDALAQKQDGKCAICGREPSGKLPLVVDHCHTTGRIRGLLCRPCNSFLGRIGDDAAKLQELVAYLQG